MNQNTMEFNFIQFYLTPPLLKNNIFAYLRAQYLILTPPLGSCENPLVGIITIKPPISFSDIWYGRLLACLSPWILKRSNWLYGDGEGFLSLPMNINQFARTITNSTSTIRPHRRRVQIYRDGGFGYCPGKPASHRTATDSVSSLSRLLIFRSFFYLCVLYTSRVYMYLFELEILLYVFS